MEREDLAGEVRRIWDKNAEWWDDHVGDGNAFQRELVEPATERLIGDVAGATILDVACGAGRFGRRMAELGAHVVGADLSERFIRRARERVPAGLGNRLEYHVCDATDREAMLSLGAGRFDGAVATMALMDVPAIEPLLDVLAAMLKPGGWFVFTVPHPCFRTRGETRFAEVSEVGERMETLRGVKVTRYLTPEAYRGIGVVGQPELHYYFHRPLHVLLGAGFRAGFVLDAMEEPTFSLSEGDEDPWRAHWSRMPEIPMVLAARMRLRVGAPSAT